MQITRFKAIRPDAAKEQSLVNNSEMAKLSENLI
jgi:hypothetical protein